MMPSTLLKALAVPIIVLSLFHLVAYAVDVRDEAAIEPGCSFPNVSSERYLSYVQEAKTELGSKWSEIYYGTIDHPRGTYSNPALEQALHAFLALSQNSETTLVRLHAFARAARGRVALSAPVNGFFGPGILFETSRMLVENPSILEVHGSFQFLPGLIRRRWGDWLLGRMMGRRYDRIYFFLFFNRHTDSTPELARSADKFKIATTVYPLTDLISSIRWGERRLTNECPETGRSIEMLAERLKAGGR